MIRQILRFSIVVGAATLIHLLVGVTLIHAGWGPFAANAAAFCVAFIVSFTGHFGFTFSSDSNPMSGSLVRFLVVTLTGFAANEAILEGILTRHVLSPTATLVVSTSLVAFATLAFCHWWAFSSS
ncbi:MAG: GtrA family protein [Roseovarius sp.]|jgi:putative flippase GtrA|nr:GtrA family protein [Roseovarius sp.]